ncbi:hypothetical protein Mgra_00004146 [Meloidogyne graminicola]|uniref:Uncharacterized protein n=1 Tax=Meloidogyne graminicola TaxID=189291 RepID=A0A8S9ZT07_9BILA|nr:hypothetical protein Mgra_00004146 [Meloidogyne graminicola]
MNNSSFSSSSGTSGVRITRRSARNWITLVSKESLTPKLSSTSKDVPGFADKYLSVSGEEDEAAVKKLTSKREKEAHERALTFVRNQLLRARRDNWLYKPIEELIGYSSKF